MTAPVAADLAVPNGATKIAVRDFGGDGPTILLLHGAGRTLVDWSLMAPLLAVRLRVVAMDLRNHGWSGEGPWRWPDVVDDVRAVIDTLALTDVTAGELDPEQAASAEAAHLQLATALGMSPELAAEAWARGMTQGSSGGVATRPSPSSSSELMTALDELELFDIYRHCPCPLLIVNAHGESPGEAPEWATTLMAAYRVGLRRDLAELAAASSHVTVQELDASHALIVEQPDAVAAMVGDFISRS